MRDIFPPGEAARIFAQMLLVLSVSPLFAPLFGGWLLLIASWRDLFWIQGALAAPDGSGGDVCGLPESHPGSDRAIHPVAVMRDYAAIARDRRFLGYVMASTLSGAGLYVYLTGWPHVVIDIFHVPPQYFGFTFLSNGIGLIVVSQATAQLLASPSGAASSVLGAGGAGGCRRPGAVVQLDRLGRIVRPAALGLSLLLPDRRRQPHRPQAWP